MILASQLFSKCIVEEEHDCLPDASALLKEIDKLLTYIVTGADPDLKVKRICKVCGEGHYINDFGSDDHSAKNFGLHDRTGNLRKYKIFACDNCGHVQVFSHYLDYNTLRNAWKQ